MPVSNLASASVYDDPVTGEYVNGVWQQRVAKRTNQVGSFRPGFGTTNQYIRVFARGGPAGPPFYGINRFVFAMSNFGNTRWLMRYNVPTGVWTAVAHLGHVVWSQTSNTSGSEHLGFSLSTWEQMHWGGPTYDAIGRPSIGIHSMSWVPLIQPDEYYSRPENMPQWPLGVRTFHQDWEFYLDRIFDEELSIYDKKQMASPPHYIRADPPPLRPWELP
jgi:hypothetical protein